MPGLPHASSYYAATRNPAPDRPALRGDITADVCVVGAGFTGLSAALHLAERGYGVVVLESNKIGWGASGRNGGQALVGTSAGSLQTRDLLGEKWARQIWELTLAAVARQKQLIQLHAIACDYRPGYLYAAWNERHFAELRREFELLRSWDYAEARLVDAAEAAALLRGPKYAGGILDRASGHLHPLNYALGLAEAAERLGCRIFEDSSATSLNGGKRPQVQTVEGLVRCRHVVLAGNAYLGHLDQGLREFILPVVTYILATHPMAEARARALIPGDLCVSDSKRLLNYYRLTADHRLLFGGPAVSGVATLSGHETSLRRRMVSLFPSLGDLRTEYIWDGTVAISRNRLPHIGRLNGEIYFAQGYSGHGVALTTLVGALIAEAIAGTAERFDVFAKLPHEKLPGGRRLALRMRILVLLWYRLQDALG